MVQALTAYGRQLWQAPLPKLNNNSVLDGNGGLLVTEYDTCTSGQTMPLTVVDVMELLLASNAEDNAKNANDETPLYWVAQSGHKDVAELLLVNNAEVNAKDNRGRTPLRVASFFRHPDVVDLLRQHGGHE